MRLDHLLSKELAAAVLGRLSICRFSSIRLEAMRLVKWNVDYLSVRSAKRVSTTSSLEWNITPRPRPFKHTVGKGRQSIFERTGCRHLTVPAPRSRPYVENFTVDASIFVVTTSY